MLGQQPRGNNFGLNPPQESQPVQNLTSAQHEIKEEVKELARASNNVYSQIIFSCQKQCLSSFLQSKQPTKEEVSCLMKCANENMFLDNFLFERDSAIDAANQQQKQKKAQFYISRRMDDLTSL
eukprot:403338359